MTLLRGIEVLDPADADRKAQLDTLFQTLSFITQGHSSTHAGDAFSTGAFKAGLAKGNTLTLAFKTPTVPAPERRLHFVFDFSTLTGGHLNFHENPSWAALTGTLNAIYNRKRESVPNSSVVLEDQSTGLFVASDNIIIDPSGFLAGTVLSALYGFGRVASFSGSDREGNTWLLKPDTTYALEFVADNASNEVDIQANWLEHTDE